jgi:hypothetical protein
MVVASVESYQKALVSIFHGLSKNTRPAASQRRGKETHTGRAPSELKTLACCAMLKLLLMLQLAALVAEPARTAKARKDI